MLVDPGQSELKTQLPGESNVTTKGKILLQNTAKRLTLNLKVIGILEHILINPLQMNLMNLPQLIRRYNRYPELTNFAKKYPQTLKNY